MRVSEAEQLALGDRRDRVRALDAFHRVRHRLLERLVVVPDQGCDHLCVRGGRQLDALLRQLLSQRGRVDEVAVVTERDRAHPAVVEDRLRVRPVRRAGGRVARVPDGNVTVQAVQRLLVEDLGDETELAHRREAAALGDGDPRRFLPAMLEREEAEVGQARDVALGGPDAEDAAH